MSTDNHIIRLYNANANPRPHKNCPQNYSTGKFDGGGTGQSPWLSNIDGNNFALTNVQSIDVNNYINLNSGCYFLNGSAFACLNSSGSIDLSNINTINGSAPGGGGGSQTPWTQNIDAANYGLNNIGWIVSTQSNFYITGRDNLFLGTNDGNTLISLYQGPSLAIGCATTISSPNNNVYVDDSGFRVQIGTETLLNIDNSPNINITATNIVLNSPNTITLQAANALFMPGLPTSPSGLPAGVVWNNGGVLNIVGGAVGMTTSIDVQTVGVGNATLNFTGGILTSIS